MKNRITHILAMIFLTVSQPLFSGLSEIFLRSYNLSSRKDIIAAARRNMPPELQACKNLEEAKALLLKEEQEHLTKIKKKFNISDEEWATFLAELELKKEDYRATHFNASYPVDHSLAEIDPNLFKQVVNTLKMYGINPGSVDIVYDKDWHDNNLDFPACSDGHTFQEKGNAARISCVPEKTFTTLETQEEYTILAPFHEAMHIFKLHNLQRHEILLELMHASGYKMDLDIHADRTIKNWERMQENIAYILPLLKFKNPEHVQLMYRESMRDCTHKIHKGEKIHWNTSPDHATHPAPCDVLLPWVIKIHELMRSEQEKTPSRTTQS
jgi:hypothetical protein